MSGTIRDEFGRMADDITRVFSPTHEGATTYHLRRRVSAGQITPATGRRAKTTTDHDISGACFAHATPQTPAAGVGGHQRPLEERTFEVNAAALAAALAIAGLTGPPDVTDSILENKGETTERRWEIVRADLLAGDSLWRITCRQPQGTGYGT